jgi:hypothetical protein
MSLELWSTVFSGATFIVIAATAAAALVQLRHMRTGNQLNALLTLMQMWDTPDMQTHIQYSRTALQERFKDPKFLAQYAEGGLSRAEHPEMLVADYWEQIGTFMKYSLVDERSWLDISAPQVLRSWDDLWPAIAAQRATFGVSAFENFEYVAVRAKLWLARYPDGVYPPNLPRMAQLNAAQTQPSPRA